jgi:hypothetical protein
VENAALILFSCLCRQPGQKKGPDLLTATPRVWIEAVMPESTEALAGPPPMKACSVPNDAYLLRLAGSIEAKSTAFSGER